MTAVLTTLTPALAREWAKAKGLHPKGRNATREAVLLFLNDNPATLRALAEANGITEGFGSRGRYAASVYEAVTDAVLAKPASVDPME